VARTTNERPSGNRSRDCDGKAVQRPAALFLAVRSRASTDSQVRAGAAVQPAVDAIVGLRGCADGDALEVRERYQIVIAGDDHVDLRSESQGEDGIVIGVAANWRVQTWRFDHLGQLPQFCQGDFARGVRACEDHVKLRAGDDDLQLGQDRGTAYQAERARADMLEQDVRRAVPEQAREQYIGVNDYPQHAVGAPHVSP
jgi:hypothetical protein